MNGPRLADLALSLVLDAALLSSLVKLIGLALAHRAVHRLLRPTTAAAADIDAAASVLAQYWSNDR